MFARFASAWLTVGLPGLGAFDISSTLGTMDTARVVARNAAAKPRATLDAIQNG
jgi:hypothetical protein